MHTFVRKILVLLSLVLTLASQAEAQSKSIVLIHGMYLTPDSWSLWKSYFEAKGYNVYAPAWPHHDASVAEQKQSHPNQALGQLELKDVLNHYRQFLAQLPEKPILIGHSMGGLIVQLLLQDKLGAAGIAIDSAPPFGVLPLEVEFFQSNWPILSPFAKADEAVNLSPAEFFAGFAKGCLSEEEAASYYDAFVVPESRRVGRAPTTPAAAINFLKKTEPLLFIAGEKDRTIPASLNYRNYLKYSLAPSLTEYKAFAKRCHLITLQDSWQEVADYTADWIERTLPKAE